MSAWLAAADNSEEQILLVGRCATYEAAAPKAIVRREIDTDAVEATPKMSMSAITQSSPNQQEELVALDVCTLLDISLRTFKQMRSLGAVDAAIGTGKSARYDEIHIEQAQRLIEVMNTEGLSMPAAAKFLCMEQELKSSKAAKTSRWRRALEACRDGNIKDLGSGVFLVVDSSNRTNHQRELLIELRRCAAGVNGRRKPQQKGNADLQPSVVHRIR